MSNNNFDKILAEVLELFDRGKSQEEVLNMFPEHKKDLNEIFNSLNILNRESEKIQPDKNLLKNILVTKERGDRSLIMRGEGRAPLFINNIFESMKLAWKIIIPAGIVAVIALVFVYSGGKKTAEQFINLNGSEPRQEKSSTPAEKKEIDDTLAGLDSFFDDENSALTGEDADSSLAVSDKDALNNYLTTYDEKEF